MADDSSLTEFPEPYIPEAPLSLLQILLHATRVWLKHCWSLTRLLFPSLLLQLVGFYGAILLSCAVSQWYLETFASISDGALSPVMSLMMLAASLGVIVASVGGMVFFIRGFWLFLLAFLAYNPVFAQLFSQPDFPSANVEALFKSQAKRLTHFKTRYSQYLLLLMLVQIAGAFLSGLLFLPFYLLLLVHPLAGLTMNTLAWTNIVATLLTLACYTCFAYGFQLVAFQRDCSGGMTVMRQSMAIVRSGFFWRTFIILVVCGLISMTLLPWVITALLSLSGLLWPVNALHHWMIDSIVNSISNGNVSSLGPLSAMVSPAAVQHMAQECSKALISFILSIVLLPWGTAVFVLLYGDVLKRRAVCRAV